MGPVQAADPREHDLLAVLAADPDLGALLGAARDRYVQLGTWGAGSIALDSEPLKRAARALGCDSGRARLSLAVLERILARTRFRCSVEEAVRWAFGAVPATRAETRASRAATWEEQRASLVGAAGPAVPEVEGWLDRDAGTLRAEWQRDPVLLESGLVAVRAAVEARTLPTPEIVPLLAHRLTGDAHALDLGTASRRYFERILLAKHGDLGLSPPLSVEDRADLLAASNLAADGVSSLVWAVGLEGGDPMLDAARAAWYPLALPLMTVTALPVVRAARQTAFVVENRSVFGALVPALADLPVHARPTLVCSSGNPSLAARTLLARLIASGARIRYGGDTDARGERIAGMLRARFEGQVERWHMPGGGAVQYQEAVLQEMLHDLRADEHAPASQ